MVETYRVRRGDTLGRIANAMYGDPARYPLIVSANLIANPDRLVVGQELVIPDAQTAGAGVNAAAAPAPATPGAATGHLEALNQQRLSGLHPIVATRGRSMIDLCAHAGIAVLITQGLRTWAEQDSLYAKGRTRPGGIVTNARGGQSWHNFGLAFDIIVLDALGKADWNTGHPSWTAGAAIGKSVGLEWGGDWKKLKDLPHYQYPSGLALPECRTLFEQGGLTAVWARVKWTARVGARPGPPIRKSRGRS